MHPGDFLLLMLALGLSLALTPAVRAFARYYGAVAQPRADRWHRSATAKFGGIAIFFSVLLAELAGPVPSPRALILFAAGAFLWLVGLIDDLLRLRAYQKLLAQFAVAGSLLALGLSLPWTPWHIVNAALTLLWLVGITNALNLLDNMDGLAAGVGALAAAFLAAQRLTDGAVVDALALGILAASLVGFLAYNRNPASIFMGDCGSLFIGFSLAAAALRGPANEAPPEGLLAAATAILPLAVPIFDVTLVTVMRPLAGRSIFQGGCDHTSHRLVALGLCERRAVRLLYGLTVLSGVASLAVRVGPAALAAGSLAILAAALILLGAAVLRVRVYEPSQSTADKTVGGRLNISGKHTSSK
jgi:UDP-GlcNAc:undecaprenyl-phosphate/decaprenyl-phosphate GlcNAc-1-phosphate transferase